MVIQSVSPQLRLSISYHSQSVSCLRLSIYALYHPSVSPLPLPLYLFLAPLLASPPLVCPTFSTHPIPSLSISPASPIHSKSLTYLHLPIPPIASPSMSHIPVPPLLVSLTLYRTPLSDSPAPRTSLCLHSLSIPSS